MFSHYLRTNIKIQSGFSLIELLVALAIGMIATLVVSQTMVFFGNQKRTTSGTADAQTNGSLALYSIQREVQLAGYGLPNIDLTSSPLNCSSVTPVNFNLSPITITSGANSDTITVRYGDSPSAGMQTSLVTGSSGNIAFVNAIVGCGVGNRTLVVNGSSCFTFINKIEASSNEITLQDSNAIVTPGSKLSCIGAWNEIVFSINSNRLERDGGAVGNDILVMKAQYGISNTATDNQIIDWVDATGATWATPSVANRNRIKAIRVALLARNNLYEKDVVTVAQPTYFDGIGFALSGDWDHYRYRVFETIIPLRNVVWSKDALQ